MQRVRGRFTAIGRGVAGFGSDVPGDVTRLNAHVGEGRGADGRGSHGRGRPRTRMGTRVEVAVNPAAELWRRHKWGDPTGCPRQKKRKIRSPRTTSNHTPDTSPIAIITR